MYGYTWLTGSELQVCTVHPYVCDVCMCVLVCVCWQILFPPFTMSPLIDLWSSPPRERLEPYSTRERESSLFLSHRHHLQLVLPPLLFISILPPVTPSLPPLLEHPFVHPPLLLNALSSTPHSSSIFFIHFTFLSCLLPVVPSLLLLLLPPMHLHPPHSFFSSLFMTFDPSFYWLDSPSLSYPLFLDELDTVCVCVLYHVGLGVLNLVYFQFWLEWVYRPWWGSCKFTRGSQINKTHDSLSSSCVLSVVISFRQLKDLWLEAVKW